MRKLTDYNTTKKMKHSESNLEFKKTKKASKLPFDIHLILKKYDSRFEIYKKCMFAISKVHITKVFKNYIEKCLMCFEPSPFEHNLSNFYNLQTVEIVGASSFDFLCCYKSNNIKLKLISVSDIIIENSIVCKDDIGIQSLVLKKLSIDYEVLEFILTLRTLKEITLYDITFKNRKSYKNCMMQIFELLNQNKNIEIIKIRDNFLEHQMISFINLSKLNRYKFSNSIFKIDFDAQPTFKNKLILENCPDFLYKNNYSEIVNLKIINQQDISNQIELLEFNKLEKVSLSDCVLSEQSLMLFLEKYKGIREIDLSNVPVSPDNLVQIVLWNKSTLRELNLNGIQVTSYFISVAKKSLKKCKIIYNDNLKIYANN